MMDTGFLVHFWLKKALICFFIVFLGVSNNPSYAQSSGSDKDKYTITGHLWSVKIEEKQVVVQNSNNRATIKVNNKTKINFNGNYTTKNKEPYSINHLKVGDYVRIIYYLEGNVKIAIKIIAARY